MRPWLLTLGCALCLAAQGGPLPTLHHLALHEQAGTWTVVARLFVQSGQPPVVSKGIEINKVVSGGLWLQSELRAEMGGQAFEGHGLSGFDTHQGAHVGSWVDGSDTWMASMKGTCARNCREQTLFFESFGPNRKVVTHKQVHVQVDHDHRSVTLYVQAPKGGFVKEMEMEYVRVK